MPQAGHGLDVSGAFLRHQTARQHHDRRPVEARAVARARAAFRAFRPGRAGPAAAAAASSRSPAPPAPAPSGTAPAAGRSWPPRCTPPPGRPAGSQRPRQRLDRDDPNARPHVEAGASAATLAHQVGRGLAAGLDQASAARQGAANGSTRSPSTSIQADLPRRPGLTSTQPFPVAVVAARQTGWRSSVVLRHHRSGRAAGEARPLTPVPGPDQPGHTGPDTALGADPRPGRRRRRAGQRLPRAHLHLQRGRPRARRTRWRRTVRPRGCSMSRRRPPPAAWPGSARPRRLPERQAPAGDDEMLAPAGCSARARSSSSAQPVAAQRCCRPAPRTARAQLPAAAGARRGRRRPTSRRRALRPAGGCGFRVELRHPLMLSRTPAHSGIRACPPLPGELGRRPP